MELILARQYFPTGTNGYVFSGEQLVCFAIELPWRANERDVSCVLEGRFEVEKRYSVKYGWHLALKDVEGRDVILFHAANDALKELKGCIAPVSMLSGIGAGLYSRKANEKLKKLVFDALERKERVFITIKSLTNERYTTPIGTDTKAISGIKECRACACCCRCGYNNSANKFASLSNYDRWLLNRGGFCFDGCKPNNG